MIKKHELGFIVVFTIMVSILGIFVMAEVSAESIEEVDNFQVLRHEQQEFQEQTEVIIDTQEELEKYVSDVEIDFETHKAALIALGQRNTGGYQINITGIEETDDTVTVNYREMKPGEGCFLTQAITYPSKLISVEAEDKELVLNQQEAESYSCNGDDVDAIPISDEVEVHQIGQGKSLGGNGWYFEIGAATSDCENPEEDVEGLDNIEYTRNEETEEYIIRFEAGIQNSNPCYNVGIAEINEDDNDYRIEIITEKDDVDVCIECVGFLSYEAEFTAENMNEVEIVHNGDVIEVLEHPDSGEEVPETAGYLSRLFSWFASLF